MSGEFKRLGILAAAVASLLAIVASPARADHPPVETYRGYEGTTLDFWLFHPGGEVPASGRPMVVYLHGCSQNNATDPQLAFGTRWNTVARRVGAVVLYPLQNAYDMEHPESVEGNGGSCWNWFLDKNMHRGRGEPKAIAELTKQVAAANGVDPSRIFVMGASAGADMANILGITYPDVFRASALFSGCAYDACRDVTGRKARKESARISRTPGPAMVIQGDADLLNNVAMGKTLAEQQRTMRRLPVQPRTTKHFGDARALNPGGGNVCAGPHANFPCPAGATGWGSYPYTVKTWGPKNDAVLEWWVIHGLGHNYPNGDYRASFTDPAGPDITSAAWRFFSQA